MRLRVAWKGGRGVKQNFQLRNRGTRKASVRADREMRREAQGTVSS